MYLRTLSYLGKICIFQSILGVPFNRVSFYGKNFAKWCPFLIEFDRMRQSITVDKKKKLIRKLCDRVSHGRTFFRVVLKQWIMYTFGKIFKRQGILLGYFLCDMVQGLERFTTLSRYFSSQVAPSRGVSYHQTFCRCQIVLVSCEC